MNPKFGNARIKKTGEVVFVVPQYGVTGQCFYFDQMNARLFRFEDLDFYQREELIEDAPKEGNTSEINEDVIDWEQRRYEIAKDVYCRMIQDIGYSIHLEASAVRYADILIAELKNKTTKL